MKNLKLSIALRIASLIIMVFVLYKIDLGSLSDNITYLMLLFYFLFCITQIVCILDEFIKIVRNDN
jgi:hypothetical protein